MNRQGALSNPMLRSAASKPLSDSGRLPLLRTGKNKTTRAVSRLHFTQDRQGLSRQGNNVLNAHFHPLGANAPFSGVEIELRPLSGAQFAGRTKTIGARRSA